MIGLDTASVVECSSAMGVVLTCILGMVIVSMVLETGRRKRHPVESPVSGLWWRDVLVKAPVGALCWWGGRSISLWLAEGAGVMA